MRLRAISQGVVVCATVVLLWILGIPAFQTADGTWNASFCLAISVAAGFALLGMAIGTQFAPTALWGALALAGQGAALQLIDAGPMMHYQHYRPIVEILQSRKAPALILGIQALIVVAGIVPRLRELVAWFRDHFAGWQRIGIILVFAASAATVSREKIFYAQELAFAVLVQAIALGNIILAVGSIPENAVARAGRFLDRGIAFKDSSPMRPRVDRFAVALAVWSVTIAALLSYFVYERHPHIADEVAYLYNARYFAAGKLVLPAVAAPDAINVDLTSYEADKWFCAVPPGWPTALALGVRLGVPWLVNPALAGVNVLLTYLLLWRLYSRTIARVGSFLLAVSPWHIFMSMNLMTHTFTITCALVAALAVVAAREQASARWAFGAGLALGIGTAIRPLDGLIVAIAIGLWALGAGGRRLPVPCLAALAAGTLLAGVAQLPYNKLLTGSATESPLIAYTDKYYGPKTNAYGFGPERGLGWPLDPNPGHTPLDAMINANLNISSINYELFGWSTGSLLLMAVLVFSGGVAGSDYGMLALMVLVFLAYSGYWFSGGPDFGARYWYLMLVPCVALTARGIEVLAEKINVTPGAGNCVVLGVAALCAFSLVNYFPWRSIDKYHHYLQMRPDLRDLAAQRHFGRSLVLVKGQRHPDYESAAIYNPVDFHADAPIYAWDRNPQVRAHALEAYPGRPVWIVDGPTITHAGYRVVAGPVSPALLAQTP